MSLSHQGAHPEGEGKVTFLRKALSARLPRFQQILIFSFLGLSWTSGLLYFALERWGGVEGEFGPERNPWLGNILATHGAGAFLILITLGFLLGTHIPPGWRNRRMRPLGAVLAGALVFMVVTGYLLYYLANEEARAATAWAHLGAGLLLPVLLGAHVLAARRKRRQLPRD